MYFMLVQGFIYVHLIVLQVLQFEPAIVLWIHVGAGVTHIICYFHNGADKVAQLGIK